MATKDKDTQGKKEVNLLDLVTKIREPMPSGYSNFAHFNITGNEIFIDFYFAGPIPGSANPKVEPVFRAIIPLTLGKATATALANAIALFEEQFEAQLPNTRQKQETDRITIWKE